MPPPTGEGTFTQDKVVTVTDSATVAQLKAIDIANGDKTLTSTVRDTVANVLNAADQSNYAAEYAAISQVSTIQITGWSNQDLDALTAIKDFNIELVVNSDTTLNKLREGFLRRQNHHRK